MAFVIVKTLRFLMGLTADNPFTETSKGGTKSTYSNGNKNTNIDTLLKGLRYAPVEYRKNPKVKRNIILTKT